MQPALPLALPAGRALAIRLTSHCWHQQAPTALAPLHDSSSHLLPLADFNYEAAKKASGNVAGLCNWAASMCKYHEVAKVRLNRLP